MSTDGRLDIAMSSYRYRGQPVENRSRDGAGLASQNGSDHNAAARNVEHDRIPKR
jgi:hypothetical protein